MAATFRGFGGLSTLSSHRQSSLVVSGAQPLTLKGSLTPQLLPHRRHRGSVQAPSSRPPLFPQRCRLEVVARRSSNSGSNRGSNNSGGARRQQPASLDKLVRQYAAPAVGLVVVGSLVAPLLGGLIFAAAGLGITMAAGAAALSLSWVVVPLFMAMFGLPALMMGGMAAGRHPQAPFFWLSTLQSCPAGYDFRRLALFILPTLVCMQVCLPARC